MQSKVHKKKTFSLSEKDPVQMTEILFHDWKVVMSLSSDLAWQVLNVIIIKFVTTRKSNEP